MIKLIVAHGINGEIGGDNKLLWSLPKDLKMFKEKTLDSSLLFGRKTRESLPSYPKGLPNRVTLVATSTPFKDIDCEDTKSTVMSLSKSELGGYLRLEKRYDSGLWFAGGKGIYEAFEHLADEIHVTEVDGSFPEADTFYKPNLTGYTEDLSQRVDVSSDTLKATAKVFIKDK